MHERPRAPSAPNIMQRVFDQLAAGPAIGVTVAELAAATSLPTGLPTGAIYNALQRLRKCRASESTCIEGVWRYRLRAGAERPSSR